MNQLRSSLFVTQVWTHGLLGHLLDHQAYQSIENAWVNKELLERVQFLSGVRVDVVE
jgi:hypothetical protein